MNAVALSWTPSIFSLFFSLYVYMLFGVLLNKAFPLQIRYLWYVNLESKDYKTLSTHSLIYYQPIVSENKVKR